MGYDGGKNTVSSQLTTFLRKPGDEARELVRQDFNHNMHIVPTASHDVTKWSKLELVAESDLDPLYTQSTLNLRNAVLNLLRRAKPMHASGVVKQLRMYTELVTTSKFSGKLVREALEEGEISSR